MLPIDPSRIDALVSAHDSAGPATAAGVFSNDAGSYSCCRGLADLDTGEAATAETAFRLGSLTKQFTAAAVALLADRGLLSIADDVRAYVPELPCYGPGIQLRHLLGHTSGIRDYKSITQMGWRNLAIDCPRRSDLFALICRQRGLNFAPGTRHMYSNSGYVLLATVVERVSGMDFLRFCAGEICHPLGMHAGGGADPVRRAIAYRSEDGPLMPVAASESTIGANGIDASVGDLDAWSRFHRNPASSDLANVARMLAGQGLLNNGIPVPYGWGQCVGLYKGLRIFYHCGSGSGLDNCYIRFRDADLSIAVLRNSDGPAACQIACEIADSVLAPAFTADEHPWERVGEIVVEFPSLGRAAPPADIGGSYYSPDVDVRYDVRTEGHDVVVDCNGIVEVYEYGPDGSCRTPHRRMRLVRGPGGTVVQLLADNRLTRGLAFDRVA